MRPIGKILVAVRDPAARAPAALKKAAALAAALGAELKLFHALSQPVLLQPFAGPDQAEALAGHGVRVAAQLARLATRLATPGARITSAVAWDYPAHEAIIRHATRSRADLIVAGGQAFKHVAPWLLRFTDWELVRQSPVPVLLVKSRQPWRRPRLLAAVDPEHAYGKTGALDADILQLAQAVKGALKGSLDAVHAYAPLPERVEAALREKLASVARRSFAALGKAQHLAPSRLHLQAGSPVEAIPALVRELGCDLVVLGTLSRSGVKRMLIGNTAEALLDALTCDVLVVKPEGFVSAVPRALRGLRVATSTLPGLL